MPSALPPLPDVTPPILLPDVEAATKLANAPLAAVAVAVIDTEVLPIISEIPPTPDAAGESDIEDDEGDEHALCMLIAGEPVDDVAIFGGVCGESGAHVECNELLPLLPEVLLLLAVFVLPVDVAAAADVVAFVLTLLLILPTLRLLLLLLLPSVFAAVA